MNGWMNEWMDDIAYIGLSIELINSRMKVTLDRQQHRLRLKQCCDRLLNNTWFTIIFVIRNTYIDHLHVNLVAMR